tara:strand:+ start:120 stop:440 length:321 start_codon:yes stop_codon:yes gene_type:complete
MEDQIANAGQNFIGEHGWLLIAGAVGLIFKETITSFAAAISTSLFGGIKTDDVYSMGGRACRVVRVGIRSTTFYFADSKTRVDIPNEDIKGLRLEKKIAPMEEEQA